MTPPSKVAEIAVSNATLLGIDRFLRMVEDFGNMSGGQFRQRYPDQDPYEGYLYVQRKGAALRKILAAHLQSQSQEQPHD